MPIIHNTEYAFINIFDKKFKKNFASSLSHLFCGAQFFRDTCSIIFTFSLCSRAVIFIPINTTLLFFRVKHRLHEMLHSSKDFEEDDFVKVGKNCSPLYRLQM